MASPQTVPLLQNQSDSLFGLRRSIFLAVLVVAGLHFSMGTSFAEEMPPLEAVDVFERGEDGYFGFRIPALLRAKDGTLLAIAEGRRDNLEDHGPIDLVLKRSTDEGRTWGPLQLIHRDGDATVGNPCPVLDRKTGTIWLPFCKNNRQVFVTSSRDSGKSWSPPREITDTVKLPAWKWYATGPGVGIQLRSGRLVIPCNHGDPAVEGSTSHVFYSDDAGESWQLGGVIPRRDSSRAEASNEAQVVELSDGRLLMNMRTERTEPRRALSTSEDGGTTWSPLTWSEVLTEPFGCQASLIKIPNPEPGEPELLLFCNPNHPKQRRNMTLRASTDDGESWNFQQALFSDFGGYSSLAGLPGRYVGVLTERDMKVQRIVYYRIPVSWLLAGREDDPSRAE